MVATQRFRMLPAPTACAGWDCVARTGTRPRSRAATAARTTTVARPDAPERLDSAASCPPRCVCINRLPAATPWRPDLTVGKRFAPPVYFIGRGGEPLNRRSAEAGGHRGLAEIAVERVGRAAPVPEDVGRVPRDLVLGHRRVAG